MERVQSQLASELSSLTLEETLARRRADIEAHRKVLASTTQYKGGTCATPKAEGPPRLATSVCPIPVVDAHFPTRCGVAQAAKPP